MSALANSMRVHLLINQGFVQAEIFQTECANDLVPQRMNPSDCGDSLSSFSPTEVDIYVFL